MGISERREREKRKRRDEILEAAQRLLSERGYEKTRMEDLADTLELSKGTVYLYFAGKEELAYAVLLRCLDVMLELVVGSSPVHDPDAYVADRRDVEIAHPVPRGLDRLYRMARAYVAFFKDHYREFYLVQMLEGAISEKLADDEGAHEFYRRLNRMKAVVVEAIREGLEDGNLRKDLQPELSAVTYMIAADGFMRQMVSRSHFVQQTSGYSREQLIEEVFRVLTHSLT